jgi:hypothetical protein
MMNDYITIFLAGFASVFMLGFQSRNVNHGNFRWAAGSAFIIGITSASLWSNITAPGVGILGGLVYGLSGALAITSSMYVHKRFIQR